MSKLRGAVRVPGDKSISHRALIFGAMAEGRTNVDNLSNGEDVRSTWACLQALGCKIKREKDRASFKGLGWRGFTGNHKLDAGNSGTTTRLLMGVLAGNDVLARVHGDESLNKRPMARVAVPLRLMGATIDLAEGGTAPLTVRGAALKGIHYKTPVASAQVKSAVLLAGVLAMGETSVVEPALSRDHTERMLPMFGAKLRREGLKVTVEGAQRLAGARVIVPGDASSAAFWAVAATLAKGSELRVENVGVNPTRAGFLAVLERMGAKIERDKVWEAGEPYADLIVRSAALHATDIKEDEVPSLVDEVPILALAAARARGVSRFRGLSELRHKESDRLAAIVELLTALGVKARAEKDDLIVEGAAKLRGARVASKKDHRLAMTGFVAGLVAEGTVHVDDPDCAKISYPTFLEDLRSRCAA